MEKHPDKKYNVDVNVIQEQSYSGVESVRTTVFTLLLIIQGHRLALLFN